EVPRGVTVIEARGKTLLPGFFDSHVHLGDINRSLRLEALFGVTTAIDLGPASKPREMRERYRNAPPAELADFLSAGIVVTVRGGHGTQYGVPIPTLDDPLQAQGFVDARIAEGSDLIKIMYEDTSGSLSLPRMPKATMKAVIEAAHARGK